MGISDELVALKELHETGHLSDVEYAAAKAAVLAGKPSQTPSAAGAAVATPVQPASSAAATQRYRPKRSTVLLLRVVFVLLALFVIWRMEGKQRDEQFLATTLHSPIQLRNDVTNVSAHSWRALPIELPYSGTLTLALTVRRGNPADVFLLDPAALANLQSGVPLRLVI